MAKEPRPTRGEAVGRLRQPPAWRLVYLSEQVDVVLDGYADISAMPMRSVRGCNDCGAVRNG